MKVRNIMEKDSETLFNLAKNNPPLDVHTPYTYWVIAKHFSDTSFILEQNGVPIGFITALETPEFIFIWQIGINERFRGGYWGKYLIENVFNKAKELQKDVIVTIDKDNIPSIKRFTHFFEENRYEYEIVGNTNIEIKQLDFEITEKEEIYRIKIK